MEKYWVYDPSVNAIERQDLLMPSLCKPTNEQGFIWTKINEGNIIKFGRCKYLPKEIINRIPIPILNTSQNFPIEISNNQENDAILQSYVEMRSRGERSEVNYIICLSDADYSIFF